MRKEQGQSHHDFRVRHAPLQEALQWLLENNKYYTTYNSFLFCTCLHVATSSTHAQTTSLHYPRRSINYCLLRLAPQCFAFTSIRLSMVEWTCHRKNGPENFGPGDHFSMEFWSGGTIFPWKNGPGGPNFHGEMVRSWKNGPPCMKPFFQSLAGLRGLSMVEWISSVFVPSHPHELLQSTDSEGLSKVCCGSTRCWPTTSFCYLQAIIRCPVHQLKLFMFSRMCVGQEVYCPGRTTISCSGTAPVVWSRTAFAGQCPLNGTVFQELTADNIGNTFTCGVFTVTV